MMYNFISGPLVWIAFIVFIGGLLYKFVTVMMLASKEKGVFQLFSFKHGSRSLRHWVIPFRSRNTRLHPIFTIISYSFHICLLVTPIFLAAHNILLRTYFGFGLPSIPNVIADGMTSVVIAAVCFYFVRRLAVPVVNYISDWKDYVLLLIVAAPFITGFLAYHQILPNELMLTLHVVSGVVWLMVIPFTRIVHMLWFPFTRAVMGSEFGYVRNSKDW